MRTLLKRSGVVCLVGLAAALCTAPSHAQGFEASGFAGGFTGSAGVGSHALFGGSGGGRIGENINVFGEVSYSELAKSSYSSSGVSATGTAKLTNFGGGLDYSFGDKDAKVRPYAVTALGVGRLSAKGTATANGSSASVSLGVSNSAYFGFGGGARVAMGKHWGLKAEARYQRYGNSVAFGSVPVTGFNAFTFTAGAFVR